MEIFQYVPTWGSNVSTEADVRSAKFGDGYEQTSPKGLNNMLEVWSLQFKDISEDTYFAIKQFLIDHKGSTPFMWYTIDGDLKTFKCKSWSSNIPSYGLRDMSMKFEEVKV